MRGAGKLVVMSGMPSLRALIRFFAVAAPFTIHAGAALAQDAPKQVTLPNGRLITPAGAWLKTAPYPFSIAVRPDGLQLAVPSIGFPFTLNVANREEVTGVFEPTRQLPAPGKGSEAKRVFVGVVFSPDGAKLYDTTGDTGAVEVRDARSLAKLGEISLNQGKVRESFSAAAVLSRDGHLLYVLDQANWRVAVIDLASRQVVASLPTGVNPIALSLSPDGHRLYLVNSGLFEYSVVPGVSKTDVLATGLHFPPFGYPSSSARNGVVAEGRKVPGLGKETSERGSSLWTYPVGDLTAPITPTKLRLGQAVGHGQAIGGAAPSAVVAGKDHVYVALAHEDAVAVVSPDGAILQGNIALSSFANASFPGKRPQPLRGVMPSGLALAQNRLYVTEAGINAVAVIDVATRQVTGHIPVGWNPSAVSLSPDGKQLFIVNTKGEGSGPNAGAHAKPGPTYVGQIEYGSISVISTDTAPDTAKVLRDNEAAMLKSEPLPHLRHVFLVIRENRTFDEILGDLPGADGDKSLARFGLHGNFPDKQELNGAPVTPNAHSIAQQFATSDSFFADSDVSADGHRWVLGIQPTPWLNLAWTSHYGGGRSEDSFSDTPGRRALGGGDDSPMPEDEPQYGSLWEHVAGAHLPILNYGEGLELEGSDEAEGSEPEGQRLALNAPLPEPVFEATDRHYPTFNLGIPDQFRFAEFKRDFSNRLRSGRLPRLIVIRLPNDHTAAPRAADGYPTKASYVADNDLALGKLLDFLSHASIWKSSAVFVTEDDAQDGLDHVDAHRSVLLVASPYVKPGYISHQHSDMGSIEKTIYEMLGLGPLNLEDALAADLGDMFSSQPHLAPYAVLPSDPRVFNPRLARFARPKNAAEAAALRDCDDSREIAREFHTTAAATARGNANARR